MDSRGSGFASLPDDCVAAVLGLVPFRERQATCALVCKRWHRLVTTEPELLREAELSFNRRPTEESELRALRFSSVLHGLRQLAPHVQRLSLSIVPQLTDAQGAAGVEAFLQARLGRCTQLEELSLYLREVPCTLGPWLAPLAGSLRRLCVDHSTSEAEWGAVPLRLQPGGLSACTQLEKLVLEGHGLEAPSAACWPKRLTSLSLMLGAGDLPASMTALQSLRWLRVSNYDEAAPSWEPVARLSGLTHLSLSYCSCLPTPQHLASLANLQSLELVATPGGGFGDSDESCELELDGALAALKRAPVTHLELADCSYLDAPPPGLSRLTSLRSLTFACKSDLPPDLISLPPGGWLGSLQRLEVPYNLIAAQRVQMQLEAATQLGELVVTDLPLPPPGPLPTALAFIHWAAARPSMKRLAIGLEARWRPEQHRRLQQFAGATADQSGFKYELERRVLTAVSALTAAALQAQARCPGLAVEIVPSHELQAEAEELVWGPFA